LAIGHIYSDLGTLLKEDVLDLIFQITPQDTPVFNMLAQDGQVAQPFHFWNERSLTTRQNNKNVEGAAFSFATQPDSATRRGNVTQIFKKEIRVSGTSQVSDRYGIANQFQDQANRRMVELKTDIEHAIVQGTLASGNTETARSLQGMIFSITLGSNQHTEGAQLTLTEDVLNDLLQETWTNGVRARDVLVNGTLKRRISGFASGVGGSAFVNRTEFCEQNDLALVNVISVYESDFGLVQIHLSRDIPQAVNVTLGSYIIASRS